ncbi:MAG: ATP-binding protein, partial [Candidatus Sericytochromatia bacterium]
QTESLSKIDFNKYLHDLTNLLSNSYTTKNITFNINCSNINLDIIKIIPTGLIINEIISNSIKYAFEIEQSDCFINICIKNKEGKIEISIDDNGIGFPKNIDFKNTNSLGLQLVNSLVSQLNGDIKLISEKGTKYIITF